MDRSRGGWSSLCTQYSPLAAGSIDGTDEYPHDHGIVRAMEAKYKPNKAVVGNPDTTIFVSRLNPRTTEETLRKVFSRFGEIKRLRLVRDIVTGFSKCYAFVEYCDRESADDAHMDAYKLVVDDKEIFVDFEVERTMKGWVPRRLGGGFGGKKESGQLRFGGRDRPFRKPIEVAMGERGDRHENKFRRNRYDDRPETRRQDTDRSQRAKRPSYRDHDRWPEERRRSQKYERDRSETR